MSSLRPSSQHVSELHAFQQCLSPVAGARQHVLDERPAGRNPPTAVLLTAHCTSSNAVFWIGHCLRMCPDVHMSGYCAAWKFSTPLTSCFTSSVGFNVSYREPIDPHTKENS